MGYVEYVLMIKSDALVMIYSLINSTGCLCNMNTAVPDIGVDVIKLRRIMMRIPILLKRHVYIETVT